MDNITGKNIGDIQVKVYKTPEGKKFFYIVADNEDVLPILDIIEDTLYKY